jgi:hypothetical protein
MSANLIPITSDGGFTTAGNITGNVANVYAMNISQSITWDADGSQIYEDSSLVLQGSIGVAITSPNTTQITANTSTWSFDNTGNLSLPEGGSIYSEGFTPSGNPGNTIILQPAGSGVTTDQRLLVYPTAGDGDHIHLTSGNLYQTELFLGSDSLFVKLANTGNVVINSNNSNGNSAMWTFDTAGNLTAPGTIIANYFAGNGGNITYQQTNTFYVDPGRTQNYTPSGSQIQPFFTITDAITAATNAGYNDTNPAFIILLENITENVTLKPGIWLTSLGTGTHGSPIITGTVTVTSSTGTTVSNHYSLSNLRIVAPTNGHCILFTGTAPQKLFVRDMWLDANGTGDGIYMDNTGSGSTLQLDIAHLSHSGSGDIYCINVTKGNCYITDIETSGATQVAAVQTGAVMTIDGSELDAVGDVVCETYGTGSLTITNSIITNTQANGYGIKINSAGSTVTIGQCLFSIPTGTGSVVYYNPAATLYGSTLAFASISFIPNTNTTIDTRVLPVPLTTVPGTIANPIFAGNITSTTTGTWTLTDNSSSSLSFDTAGKAGVLKLVTTNSAEGVTMSGTLSVTGNANVGNIGTGGLVTSTGNITGGNITTGGLVTATGNITGANLITGGLITATSNVTGGNIITAGTMSSTGNAIHGNISTAGLITATGNITGGNIIASGNIVGNTNGFTIGYLNIPQVAASNTTLAATDGGKHYYSTTAGNFTLTVPNNSTTSFATGTAISIVVQAAGNILVNAASGVTLYMAGNSTAANRVVGGYGMATLMKVATDTWFINGTGVS